MCMCHRVWAMFVCSFFVVFPWHLIGSCSSVILHLLLNTEKEDALFTFGHLVSGELLPVTTRDWAAQFRWSLIMLSSWVSLIEQLATKLFEVRCQLLAPQLAPASLPELSGTDQMITIFGQAWSFWWYPICIGVNFEDYFEVEPFSSWLNYGPLVNI